MIYITILIGLCAIVFLILLRQERKQIKKMTAVPISNATNLVELFNIRIECSSSLLSVNIYLILL